MHAAIMALVLASALHFSETSLLQRVRDVFALNSNRLKRLDPYHVVIGAIESIDMFVFTTKNVFVPEASLDVPMLENYAAYVAQNAAKGTAFGQVRNDILAFFSFLI